MDDAKFVTARHATQTFWKVGLDLDELITPADHDELIAVLERSVVASGS